MTVNSEGTNKDVVVVVVLEIKSWFLKILEWSSANSVNQNNRII